MRRRASALLVVVSALSSIPGFASGNVEGGTRRVSSRTTDIPDSHLIDRRRMVCRGPLASGCWGQNAIPLAVHFALASAGPVRNHPSQSDAGRLCGRNTGSPPVLFLRQEAER